MRDEEVGDWVKVGVVLVSTIGYCGPGVCHATVAKLCTKWWDRERSGLGLCEVFLIVICKECVHLIYVVNASPLGVGVFGMPVVNGDLKVIHVTFGGGVDISIKTLKHCPFGFSFDDSGDNGGGVSVACLKGGKLTLGEEFITEFVGFLDDCSKSAFCAT